MRCFGNNGEFSVRVMNLETKLTMSVYKSKSRKPNQRARLRPEGKFG